MAEVSSPLIHSKPVSPKSGTPPAEDRKAIDLPVIKRTKTDVDRSKPLPTSLQSDFIPEDILLALTLPPAPPEQLGPVNRRKNASRKAPAAVWSHPKRREKFRHLVDSTVCVCGAGKDISFLYDVPKQEEKADKPDLFDASAIRAEEAGLVGKKQPIQLPDTLVPDEYHIVKNKGVLGLEYHDEPYSTQVEDHDKHLVVFPSMNPTSRYEVLQLKRTLGTMLEKAGVDSSPDQIQPGETQMHRLLELIRSEQDIYNIVFHEIIRQVSVECIERGELLAFVRQKYSTLLGKVPRQVKSLHEEVMAQRALDRRLTEELMRFKFTIGSLTDELTRVKDHDKYVSIQAIAAQDELKRALADSEKNASLLAEYHDLYELQRKRLEFVVSQLTCEKELWSVAAYCLALKVTEEKNLQTAKRLQLSEKCWQKLANHFTILLSNQDTTTLTVLQSHVDTWRDYIETFNFNIKRRDEEMKDHLLHLQEDIEEFRGHFSTTHLMKSTSVQKIPDKTRVAEYYNRMKSWEEMIQIETEKFGGEGLISMQEDLGRIKKEMDGWTEAALKVFGRHLGEEGESYPDHQTMLEMNDSVHELLNQYQVRLVGDNGVARGLIGLSNILEIWDSKFNTMLHGSNPLPEGDWIRFHQLLDEWSNSVNEIVELIGSTQKEDDRAQDKQHKVVEYIDAVKLTQRWASSATNGIDSEDSKLAEQVAALHTDMTKWMVQMLLRIAPDKEDTSKEASEMALLGSLSVRELKSTAQDLFVRLHSFTHYVVQSVEERWIEEEMEELEKQRIEAMIFKPKTKKSSCCDNIVKEELQLKLDNQEDDADKELKDLMLMKTECDDWIQIAILLVNEMSGDQLTFVPLIRSQAEMKGTDETLKPEPTEDVPEPEVKQKSEVTGSQGSSRTEISDKSQSAPPSEQIVPPTPEERPTTATESVAEQKDQSEAEAEESQPISDETPKTPLEAQTDEVTLQIITDESAPVEQVSEDADGAEVAPDAPVEAPDAPVEAPDAPEEPEEPGEPPAPEGEDVQWLGQDKNTYYKPLEQDPQQAPPESEYAIEAPVRDTPDTKRAYEALAQVDKLQQQVVEAEIRAQESEDKTRSLESELESALEKVRALERKLTDAASENESKPSQSETKTAEVKTPASSEVKLAPAPPTERALSPSGERKEGRRGSSSSLRSSSSRKGSKKK